MADRLKQLGKRYSVHYAGRTIDSMAFHSRLTRDHGDRLTLYVREKGVRLDLPAVLAAAPKGFQAYLCGPGRLIDEAVALANEHRIELHVERFSGGGQALDPTKEHGFEVHLRDSGVIVYVPSDQTILQALRANGVDVPSDCEEGLCGTCEVGVLEGAVDHRDAVLSEGERRVGQKLMACCSRACGSRLTLAL